MVRSLPPNVQFSDFKAGKVRTDQHWSKREVLAGRKGGLTLGAALRQSAITKLDLLIPVKMGPYTRVVELTNFYYVPGISRPFGDFVTEMENDITKYTKLNKKLKVLKRRLSKLLWTDKKQDQREIQAIKKILVGNLGRLAALVADCETARLIKRADMKKKHLAWLSYATGKPVTMRNLGAVEAEIQRTINEEVTGRWAF